MAPSRLLANVVLVQRGRRLDALQETELPVVNGSDRGIPGWRGKARTVCYQVQGSKHPQYETEGRRRDSVGIARSDDGKQWRQDHRRRRFGFLQIRWRKKEHAREIAWPQASRDQAHASRFRPDFDPELSRKVCAKRRKLSTPDGQLNSTSSSDASHVDRFRPDAATGAGRGRFLLQLRPGVRRHARQFRPQPSQLAPKLGMVRLGVVRIQ